MDSTFRVRFPGYSSSTNYGQSYQHLEPNQPRQYSRRALKAAGRAETRSSTATKRS